MVTTDVELQLTQQLKEAGKLLSNPPASVDELLNVLDQTEKLLSKVDQTPYSLMQEALRPSMKALVERRLLKHSNMDVKVAVAACISEITRITAPDAPYGDEEMKDAMQLIVSTFENLWDDSSQSYGKRASIVETVSKVRSCVIMLDLECDELIVEMFEHLLKSVRDHHLGDTFSSMKNIMVIVFEESEEILVDFLKPLLASIKNDSEGVLPIARKLGEEVLQKSAAKLRPYLIQALSILGDSLDNYSQVLASICKGKTDVVEHKDDDLVQQQTDESKLVEESSNKTPQADENKVTTASSDDAPQVVVGNTEGPFLEKTDATSNRSLKLIISNGKMVTGNEEGSAEKESPKKSEEAINHLDANLIGKVETDDSVTEKLAKAESSSEGNKSDTTMKSDKPSDRSHVHGENEPEKLTNNQRSSSKDIRSSPGRESSTGAVIPSENTNIPVSVSKAIESYVVNAPSQSSSLPDESYVKKDGLSKKQVLPQQEEAEAANAGSQSQIASLTYKSRNKKAGRPRKKSLSRDDGPSMDVVLTKAPEGLSDSDMKSPKRRRKKAPIAQEDKHPATVATVDDGKATSGPEPELLKMSSKKADTKPLKRSGKKVAAGDSVAKKPKMSGKKIDVGELEAKKPKQAGKNMDAGDAEGKPSRPSLNKEDVAKPLRQAANKGEKRRVITKPGTDSANKESSDSDDRPLQFSGKKGYTSSSTLVKYSSKSKDGKKQGRGKNEKDEEKSLPDEDGMDVSLKSALRAARREGNLEEARVTTSKRKQPIGKDKVTENIMYDDSLVGLKVKVYWPMDKMYYEGVIESFDSNKNKHKVLYLDGQHEILNLRKQRWEILQEFSAPVEEKAAEVQSFDGSPEIPKKKSKIDSGASASKEKLKDSAKRAGGASLSAKSKGPASTPAISSKGEGKVDNKLEDNNSKDTSIKSKSKKNSGKSVKAANSKEAGMSKEDDEETPKIITKNKQGTQKMVNKSKVKTPESGKKANDDDSSKPKFSFLNVKESEEGDAAETPESAKGKSAGATKAGSKSGKKRKKRT